ncbi:hypothetical protein ACIQU6_20740 [Streptomyces sp. NPDC090442]|uniref:hypothetical protein n=1 Tax=Streptomyces sp. NPDC090442 TaxID=3365962 RepID=UPI0037FC92DC
MAQRAGNVMSIDQAVAELEKLQSKLDPDDGVAVFDTAARTLQHLIDLWSIDAAGKSVQVLWKVRRSHDAYTAASDVLDRPVERVRRALLTPV